MLLPITGTIHNAVKLAALDSKWQQKKKNAGKEEQKDIDPQVKQYQEDMARMRESRQKSSIDTKLNSGAELTQEELEYLKKNNPEMYRQALEIKQEKEAYERQLKACHTKEDVEKLKVSKMGNFMAEAESIMNNANIPKAKKVSLMGKLLKKVMGIDSINQAFVQSAEYSRMPEEEDEQKQMETDEEKKTKDALTDTEIEKTPETPEKSENPVSLEEIWNKLSSVLKGEPAAAE